MLTDMKVRVVFEFEMHDKQEIESKLSVFDDGIGDGFHSGQPWECYSIEKFDDGAQDWIPLDRLNP